MGQRRRNPDSAGEPRRAPPPLDAERLERLALHYVGRYATTRAKLAAYLRRKLAERGWAEAEAAPVDALVERIATLGYVDDAAFAVARAGALARRGYGGRRQAASLRAAGIAEDDMAAARAAAECDGGAWASADAFARRRRLGPYAAARADAPGRQKALAAMLRAGHALDVARRFAAAAPGEHPSPPD